jgi:carbon storage regulator
MLYLSRKIGESIIINNSIELQVVEVRGKNVKLGFTFPPDASVLRKELYDKIMSENLAAAAGDDGTADFLSGDFQFDDFDVGDDGAR